MSSNLARTFTINLIVAVCVGVFIATAVATVMDLFNLLDLKEDIRLKLHVVLLVEIVGVCVTAFAGFLNPGAVIEEAKSVQKENKKSRANLGLIRANLFVAQRQRTADIFFDSVESLDASLAEIEKSAQRASSISLPGARVLWVDNNPENNRYEREAIQDALDVTFDLASSTGEALGYLKNDQYAAVISDFKRPDDSAAGYTLLEEVKKLAHAPPYIIYSGSATPEFIAEAKSRGAFGQTNRPNELLDLVIEAIKTTSEG